MYWPRFSLTLLSGIALVHSFPTAENLARLRPTERDVVDAVLKLREKRLVNLNGGPIDVSGEHEFRPPSSGDERGPCPGLNALVNHGYLPRDGVASFSDIIVGTNQVLGMGIDLATVLSAMGTVWTGNPLSLNPGFSIGGVTSKVTNLLGNVLGLFGTPRGLEGSHNWIEADSSFTRNDLYVTGDATTMNMDLFLSAYNSVEADYLTFDDVAAIGAERFTESKASNPYFYYGPLTGMVVRNAAYLFAARLLGNHSAEFPEGRLTKEVFKSFWAVYDEPSAPNGLVYKQGWEQIPANWYRIPVDYGLVSLNLDLLNLFRKQPELMSIGGNTGTVNSFTGVDFTDLPGGLANTGTLLEDNNLICFVLEIVKTVAPNSLSGLFKTLEKPLGFLSDILSAPIIDLSCPVWSDLTTGGDDIVSTLLERFPGAAKAGSVL